MIGCLQFYDTIKLHRTVQGVSEVQMITILILLTIDTILHPSLFGQGIKISTPKITFSSFDLSIAAVAP